MELSDVYVNDNDLDKFHQNYCRTHWPYQGMACEVKDCGSYIYPTLRKYMRHLHRIHKDHQDLLVCHRCTQNFVKIYSLTRHLQSDHDLLLAVSKEMAAEASVIKKKLTNSSTLRGILFRQYFGKTTTKLRRTTRIRQLKRENWRKRERNRSRREQAKLEEHFTGVNSNSIDEVIEFDEDGNALLKFKKNNYPNKEELLITSNFTAKNFEI